MLNQRTKEKLIPYILIIPGVLLMLLAIAAILIVVME